TFGCQFFWQCPTCDEVIRPKQGDCCVYCSYGDHPCPSIQQKEDCC
ncbi:MAG: GDCCVxC domain-containing (seleno)protein, partial [Bacteroidota bacterium]